MNESATRKELIDLHLKDAGWDVKDHTQVIEEYVVELNFIDQLRKPTEQ